MHTTGDATGPGPGKMPHKWIVTGAQTVLLVLVTLPNKQLRQTDNIHLKPKLENINLCFSLNIKRFEQTCKLNSCKELNKL